MKFKNENSVARMAGYTIDQTILIVAVIAVLITLVIASVGFDVLTRTGGTRLSAQLTQLEEAAGRFYVEAGGVWPEEAADLMTGRLTSDASIGSGKSYFKGVLDVSGNNLEHNLGTGGDILLLGRQNTTADEFCPGVVGARYIQFELTNIPITEATKANEVLDGITASATGTDTDGRLRWSSAPSSSGVIDLEFCANQVE